MKITISPTKPRLEAYTVTISTYNEDVSTLDMFEFAMAALIAAGHAEENLKAAAAEWSRIEEQEEPDEA